MQFKPCQESRLCDIFICEIFGKEVYPNVQRFVWRCHVGVPLRGTNVVARKPTETSVFQFSYKSMNSLLEKLTKIKVIFILRQGKFRLQNLKKLMMFLLTHIRALLAQAKCCIAQKLGNSSVLYCKTKNPFKPNMNE